MATKSIYKNVTISTEKSGCLLADALEKAHAASSPTKSHNMPNKVAKHDIRNFLEKVK